MKKDDFVIRRTSNMMVSAKKQEVIRILGKKMEKTSTIDMTWGRQTHLIWPTAPKGVKWEWYHSKGFFS